MASTNARDLLGMPEGWDGYHGRKITPEAVGTAEALQYVPLSDGGIQIEMHAGGSDVEIEIGPTGAIHSVYWARAKERSDAS